MILLALATAVAQPSAVVRTDDGPVRGEALAAGGAVFRGIRFAAAPAGPLRWRAPRRPARWTVPVDTTLPHAACPQSDYGEWNRAAAQSGAEDCLFLDIRTPRLAASAKLPVLVWIHGGANRGGAGGGTVESTITDTGIVLVSIQYRLGALGFMSHPALSAEQGGTSGNYGLMDQQAALDWVRRNISHFGGDPAKVTIAGGSAGAQDVGLQMLSPGARGLFAQAIEQSGTAGFGVAPRTLAQNEGVGMLIASKVGLPPAVSAAGLRAVPVEQVLAAQDAVDVPDLDDDSFIWLQAVIDGRVLRETPAAALAAGRINPARTIIGVNTIELSLHGGLPAARATMTREFGAQAGRALALYGLQAGGTPVADPRMGDVTAQLANDLTFRCPTVAVSQRLTAQGIPVWQYQFDHAAPGGSVTHGSELSSVFNTVPGAPLRAYWTNFVRTGDPNGAGLPQWPRYDVKERGYLSVGQEGPVAARDLRGDICALRDTP
ncbi:carboxylesterase [Sphingomonas sp. Leaf339]|uniref:carboxylesterase/lipase family protein n=1 Tax=Sphingomonas sp. Leaf339 TaxID=1736343 RepID=UPI0006FFA3C7|nr:carboxylesterase family protein [Sphingomonas sp. Leaf339]KQU61930.1 carboxylesterase [Sphingomonas sp. Leaf339]